MFFEEADSCLKCGQKFNPKIERESFSSGLCKDCLARLNRSAAIWEIDDNTFCFSASFYNNFLREMLIAYKFSSASYFEKVFNYLMTEFLKKHDFFKNFSAFAFIPGTRRKEILRGIYPSKTLARTAAAYLGLPLIDILDKKKNVKNQKELKAHERHRNIRGAFYLKKGIEIRDYRDDCAQPFCLKIRGLHADSADGTIFKLKAKPISRLIRPVDSESLIKIQKPLLLIDDLITTGATISEGLLTLRKAGLAAVGLCLASVALPDEDMTI